MIRTSFFFWASLALLAFVVNVASAKADCQWRVSGVLEGEAPSFNGAPPRRWVLANTEVRLVARWSNMACPQIGLNAVECAWNGAAWPATQTDSQGRFTVLSTGFPDPVCQKDRDFRIEVRGFPVTSWTVADQQDDLAGPNRMNGPYTPLPRHRVSLDPVRTALFPEPDIELTPSRGEPRYEPADNIPSQRDGNRTDRRPHVEEIPCGLEGRGANATTEFRFGPFSQGGDNVSFDRALMIELRPNGSGQMTLNRIRAHVLVQNAGARSFTPSNRCAVRIELRTNEGPGERGSGNSAWFPYDAAMPAVPANGEVAYSDQANLLGAGDILVGGTWTEDWEYALIEVALDHTNEVFEQAEGDNVIQHCYHAPENRFVAMTFCTQ